MFSLFQKCGQVANCAGATISRVSAGRRGFDLYCRALTQCHKVSQKDRGTDTPSFPFNRNQALLLAGSITAAGGGFANSSCEEEDQLRKTASRSSVIRLSSSRSPPNIFHEASNVLKNKDVAVLNVAVSTDESGLTTHRYTVQEGSTGEGLSDARLKDACDALKFENVESDAAHWPVYTSKEVSEHKTREDGIWVSYKDGVYDITKFIENHPGGKDKIMLAAGKAIDPFWRIYQQHEGRGAALRFLADMRIGDLADPIKLDTADDPYDRDPGRHPGLIFHNTKPCNAELPAELLMDSWETPNLAWFIRHHHPVPLIDPEKFKLDVEGPGTKPVTLTLDDLKTRFLKREVVSTIQCGGNRRGEFNKVEQTSGIAWGFGAISTARWGGVYLREVLMHCAGLTLEGVASHDVKHVICHGLDDMQASIPIEKALSPFGDVLLAYEMNGEPLPEEHGAPVRLIVPGVVGVRNVKWVGRICASSEEAEGTWQRGAAYKSFAPGIKSFEKIDTAAMPSIQEMPVTSSIVYPKPGTTTELDDIEVTGFAWAGGGHGIIRVDVSLDDGLTWETATLTKGSEQGARRAWAWTFWEANIEIPEAMRGKEITICCRATDSSCNVQPESPGPIWNIRGLNNNSWHRVTIIHNAD